MFFCRYWLEFILDLNLRHILSSKETATLRRSCSDSILFFVKPWWYISRKFEEMAKIFSCTHCFHSNIVVAFTKIIRVNPKSIFEMPTADVGETGAGCTIFYMKYLDLLFAPLFYYIIILFKWVTSKEHSSEMILL